MTGKVLDADKSFKAGNKLNSNMVKISSSKSILSYQNGSALNSENRGCTEEGTPEEGSPDDLSPSEDPFAEAQNLKSECLDLLRKKLISDLSLTVFSCDLENKLTKMEPIEISKERQSVIQKLVVQISQLSDPEKLLLYLKLPSSTSSPFDPLRQPLNPLGNRQEIQQTIVWIKTHLEEDSEISIPKQDVYDQYLKYCENVSMKPLSTADFGKVMKQVYPGVRPRRLGTRGNSRYCYSGMRNTCKLPTPILPRSSMENSPIANGCSSGVSSFLAADVNKVKKAEKPKRKLSSAGCRTDSKPSSSPFTLSGCQSSKAAKRSKAQKEVETTESEEKKNGQEHGPDKPRSEGGSDCGRNSSSAFNMECQLGGGPNAGMEQVAGGEDSSREIAERERVGSKGTRNETAGESGLGTAIESRVSTSNGDQTIHSRNDDAEKANGLETCKDVAASKRQKGGKGKSKKWTGSSLKQTNKHLKKLSYVPIQPKPAETTRMSVRFEATPHERSQKTDGMELCEESDSQEPEEEIVRYFKHLDEREMTVTKNLVEQAVNNIDSNSVQISSISQLMTDSRNPGVSYGSGDGEGPVLNEQVIRSQSCFEEDAKNGFGMEEKRGTAYLTRSQSSVELPTTKEASARPSQDSDSDADGKKNKISHLRILLEKSITSSGKNPYSRWPFGSQVGTTPNSQSSMIDPHSQAMTTDPNYLVKTSERDLVKLNGLKVVGKSHPFVPQSPNTRTKYFSFTPISPGPQSPMKTPSASPFVSPRNTPVSRSRQNSYNDHFLSPSERKPGPPTENFFSFHKGFAGGSAARRKGCKSPSFCQVSRPRSYSSTSFYRSKTRRNASKAEFEGDCHATMKTTVQSLTPNNYSLTSAPFSVAGVGNHFVGGESLSGEVEKFLENSTKVAAVENQVSTLRSRSVPLNRMIGESSWLSSPVYSGTGGYFTPGNPGKMTEMVAGPGEAPTKSVIPTISGFMEGNDGMDALSGEIFTGDPSIVALNDQYFSPNFQRSTEEAFTETQPFNGDDSTFSNKLDLNSSATFDSAFASDTDAALTDNIKSYLPDFGGLDNKSLVEGSGEPVTDPSVQPEGKLFKTSLYGGTNDNIKDPVITSFKPVLMTEMSSSPGSPVLSFFGGKINEDSQQLIEFFDFED